VHTNTLEHPRKTPEYLCRKEREVLKEGEFEWSAVRSAASECEMWKDLCKQFASAGRRGSSKWRKYLLTPSEPVAFSLY
jgi:hypothetical protein